MQWFWKLASFILVVAALYLARDVLIPMALALLFSFLFHPLVWRLQRFGTGRIPAVLITFTLATALIGGIIFHVGNEFATLVNDVPRFKTELIAKVKGIGGLSSGLGDKLDSLNQDLSAALDKTETDRVDGPGTTVAESAALETKGSDSVSVGSSRSIPGTSPSNPVYVAEVVRSGPSWLSWAESAGAVAGPLGTASLVIVFTLFMMIYQDDLRDRVIKLVSGGQYVTTTRAINESAERISSYLVAQAIVNASYGLVMTIGLLIIGMLFGRNEGFPNFLLWGFLCAVLRFVPYIGPVVAGFFSSRRGYHGFSRFQCSNRGHRVNCGG